MSSLRKAVDNAALAARVIKSSGLLGALHPLRWIPFFHSLRDLPFGPGLAAAFHGHNTPDKECLVQVGDGGQRRVLSWREFESLINQLGHGLAGLGVRPGDRTAIMLPNGIDYLVVQQALLRIGGVAVQIGYRLKTQEIAYILGNAEPSAIIVDASYLPTMEEARKLLGISTPMVVAGAGDDDIPQRDSDSRVLSWDEVIADQPTTVPTAEGPDQGGVIVYTSGTTGKPKGAKRSWKQTGYDSVADMFMQCGYRTDDRHLVVCPLYHSAAPSFVAMMMSLGATCVLVDHFDPEQVLSVIERERITCSMMVPTMLGRICALPEEVRRKYDTSSLRWVMSGAAPLPTDTARRFQESFGAVLWNFYGSTETGLVTMAAPGDHVARPGTIGRALRGNEILLLDNEGREVEVGEIGELYSRNSTMITGYHRNEQATSESMREGFFSVGDLARRDADGYYYLESRKHDMVISGGVNIYPREIEDHLMTHPAILDVAVVGVPDVDWGETLRAFVVVAPGTELDEAAVVQYCRQHLADFKRPQSVRFLPELPRNPTGKVLKRELRAL